MKQLNLYLKLLKFLTKQGKSHCSKKIINKTFLKLSQQTKVSAFVLLVKLFSRLNTFVELRKIRKRRSFHLVPFSLNFKRRSYLVVKWLIQALKTDTRNINTSEKLFFEIKNTIFNSSSKALKIKKQNISQILLNRSNVHFRW
jgi:ribosomal protein S7